MRICEVKCANCGSLFKKEVKEYKRQTKLGKKRFFCSLSCASIIRNQEHPVDGRANLIPGYKRKNDNLSPFRWFVSKSKRRSKLRTHQFDLSIDYLKQLWEMQKGICPITGWKLVLPQNTSFVWDKLDKRQFHASLDRIDNSKGYIQGNVRFVCYMANIARNIFTDEDVVEFCKAVANYQNK